MARRRPLENKLKARVLQRISELRSEEDRKDVHAIAEYLRNAYRDYQRLSNVALKRLISNVVYETDTTGAGAGASDSDPSSSSSDDEQQTPVRLVTITDSNALNRSLLRAYQTSIPQLSSPQATSTSLLSTASSPYLPASATSTSTTTATTSSSASSSSSSGAAAAAVSTPSLVAASTTTSNTTTTTSNTTSSTSNPVLGAATLQTAYTPSASIIAAAQSTPSLKSTPMPKRRRDGASAAATPRPKRLKKSSEGAGGGPFSVGQGGNDPDGFDGGSFVTPAPPSSIRFADIGGADAVLQDVRELIEWPITHPELYAHLGVEPPRGILLHGPPGCGKTLLANAIAGELGVPFFKVSGPELVSGMSGESEKRIRELFSEAITQAPSIIFFDEIDTLAPNRENVQREMEKRIVAQLLTCMGDLPSLDSPSAPLDDEGEGELDSGSRAVNTKVVLVIGATNRPHVLDPALRRAGRFDREISLGVPDTDAREQILRVLAAKLRLSGDFDFRSIAKRTPGYVGADLKAITKEAAVIAVNRIFRSNLLESSALQTRPATADDAATPVDDMLATADRSVSASSLSSPSASESESAMAIESTDASARHDRKHLAAEELKRRQSVSNTLRANVAPLTAEQLAPLAITMQDFEQAIKRVQPSAKREGFATVPDVSWENVGALESVRKELSLSIMEPIRRPYLFKTLGISSPAGVLLYGPPGCGKTMLAKGIANEANANFISVKGPELLNKYVGESERAVRQVFERARTSSPCVVFFDELDALCPRRAGDSSSAASERVVNQLLTEMDGLDSRGEVFVIAATNRPDIIDPAMVRPGRLDKPLYVPLPSKDDRVDILRTLCRATPVHESVDLQKIAWDTRCNRFSGADLAALVREACLACASEFLEKRKLEQAAVAAASGDTSEQQIDEEEEGERAAMATLRVCFEHFDVALGKVQPSVSAEDELVYGHGFALRNALPDANTGPNSNANQ